MKKAKSGLKTPKPSQKGLKKLPTAVRNNMGYAKKGTKVKKAQDGEQLTLSELKALAHQKRGMGNFAQNSFVKKADSIKNETGMLTIAQKKQLDNYMSQASTAKRIYEALPNIGRMLGHGNSAADIPKGSQLENQKKGGSIKKMKK